MSGGCAAQVTSRQFVTADTYRPSVFMSDTLAVTSPSVSVFTQLGGACVVHLSSMWGFGVSLDSPSFLLHPQTRFSTTQPFCFLLANTATSSINIHRVVFVSLFVEATLIVVLIRIHQARRVSFNYSAKLFVLLIVQLHVLFSLRLRLFISVASVSVSSPMS